MGPVRQICHSPVVGRLKLSVIGEFVVDGKVRQCVAEEDRPRLAVAVTIVVLLVYQGLTEATNEACVLSIRVTFVMGRKPEPGRGFAPYVRCVGITITKGWAPQLGSQLVRLMIGYTLDRDWLHDSDLGLKPFKIFEEAIPRIAPAFILCNEVDHLTRTGGEDVVDPWQERIGVYGAVHSIQKRILDGLSVVDVSKEGFTVLGQLHPLIDRPSGGQIRACLDSRIPEDV